VTTQDLDFMWQAIELSRLCPPVAGAYSVGAVVTDSTGQIISTGYSRETDTAVHAEESALIKAQGDPRLPSATIYTTLEPCSQRASRPTTCTQWILSSGITRVVIAWREPALFVADCQGVELLTQAGLTITELTELSDEAKKVNSHLSL
jgi:diaminohydroxyphosphoribosylaminopyrimidine deaminase / 5-amino-6-(5-phosphoribosylamino)uracil reductase